MEKNGYTSRATGLSGDCNEVYIKAKSSYGGRMDAMWIASPNQSYGQEIFAAEGYTDEAKSSGILTEYGISKYAGFRPVICLKGEVELEKVSNGKYSIIE